MAIIEGTNSNDTIRAIELGFGNEDNIIIGNGGNDLIVGGNETDQIQGNSGNDTLEGGLGRDFIQGGSGNDLLIGGPGNDVLVGGSDFDFFIFDSLDRSGFIGEGIDLITDFNRGEGDIFVVDTSNSSDFSGASLSQFSSRVAGNGIDIDVFFLDQQIATVEAPIEGFSASRDIVLMDIPDF